MTWIFGYGSLIWRPGFSFETRCIARLNGWVRRFSQGSPDHRGTPERPGRVVNLHPQPGGSCVGMAFQVAGHSSQAVLAQLDIRESGGYVRQEMPLLLSDGSEVSGVVYIAPQDNPHHLGLASMMDMANQIRTSKGPSGKNRDYIFRLEAALAGLALQDEHVIKLANALRGCITSAESQR